ncbi:MAG: hypothetical protein COA78_01235 [Blastopirellula sp.]|nr:MAG: hypothetical protein COA78_01235 [Blastopirellula sp.]
MKSDTPHIKILTLVTLLFASIWTLQTSEIISEAQAVKVPNLKQTLTAGLKARKTKEHEFIAKVVVLVNNGKLPLKTVMTSFKWARSKDDKIPFIYFENALRKQAKKIKVTI